MQNQLVLGEPTDMVKPDLKTVKSLSTHTQQPQNPLDKQQHPLHQFDLTVMSKFYSACVEKLREQNPKFKPTEWATKNPMPTHLTWEQKNDWINPFVFSHKQRVYDAFARYAKETGEPMVLMPNFDYGDILNFERFLQALKQDGVNAIGKYKLYLNNKDMRKFEIDLVVIHPRYGVLLFEVKDCDHLDNKRRSRAKAQLNNASLLYQTFKKDQLLLINQTYYKHQVVIKITLLQAQQAIAVPHVN